MDTGHWGIRKWLGTAEFCIPPKNEYFSWQSKMGMFQIRSRHYLWDNCIFEYCSWVVTSWFFLFSFCKCLLFHNAGSKVTMNNHQDDLTTVVGFTEIIWQYIIYFVYLITCPKSFENEDRNHFSNSCLAIWVFEYTTKLVQNSTLKSAQKYARPIFLVVWYAAQNFDVERFNFGKLSKVEVRNWY